MIQLLKFIRPALFSILGCFLFFQVSAQQGTLLHQFHTVGVSLDAPLTVYTHQEAVLNTLIEFPIFEYDGAQAIVSTTSAEGFIPIYKNPSLDGDITIYNAQSPGPEGNPSDWVLDFYAIESPIPTFTTPVYRYRAANKWDFLSTNPNIKIEGYEKSILFHTAAPTPAIIGKSLGIQLIGQETSVWCWAGLGEMTMKYFATFVDQCQEAETQISTASNCCPALGNPFDPNAVPQTCKKGGDFGAILTSYNFSSDQVFTVLTFEQLKAEIDADRPVAFSYKTTSSNLGHIMLVAGYIESGSTQFVLVHDPWPVGKGAKRLVTYDDWKNPKGKTHRYDYINITDNN